MTKEITSEGAQGCCCGQAKAAEEERSCCAEPAASSACCCGEEPAQAGESCCCQDEPAGSSCCCGESAGESSCCCADSESSCCCGGESDCCCDPVNGCCDPDASADDPNLERKKTVIVDYLYLDQSVCDRCQGTDERVFAAIDILRPVMDMAGYNLVVNRVEIENEYLAQRFEFASSPTVRVNGIDICPEIIENECDCCRTLSSYDVFCRQFSFNGKLYEVPPTAYVVKRILEIVFSGQKPSYEPYEMPENIRGFLREKYDQSTARAAE